MSSPSKSGHMAPLRVIIVEDEPLFRDLLSSAIVSKIQIATVVGTFGTAEECLKEAKNLDADVLLTDIDLGPGMNGVSLGVEIRRTTGIRGVVLLSNLALPNVIPDVPEDVADGWGYLLKTSASNIDQVGRALLVANQGGVMVDDSLVGAMSMASETPLAGLTPRQLDVLARMASGWSNKKIAADLFLTTRSVESVVHNIIENLGLRDAEEGLNPRVSSILLYLKYSVANAPTGSQPMQQT
ncbi:MAG: response regulator transcription factor [Candidatus Nanopelagicales bacterium]